MPISNQVKGLLLTTLGVIAFVPDSLFIKLISIEPVSITFWRSGISGFVILIILILFGRFRQIKQFMHTGLAGVVYIILMSFATFMFVYAIRTTSVANTLFILSTSPMFAAIASRVLLKEPISVNLAWAIGFSISGIGIIAYGSTGTESGALMGDLAALAVAASIGLKHTIVRSVKQISMVPAVAVAQILLAIFLYIVVDIQPILGLDLLYILILGILFIPIATSLMALGPRYITAPEVSLILLLEAILAPLLVWVVLGEQPTIYALIGGGIVMIVLIVFNMRQLRRYI